MIIQRDRAYVATHSYYSNSPFIFIGYGFSKRCPEVTFTLCLGVIQWNLILSVPQ